MEAEFTSFEPCSNWVKGKVGKEITFDAKLYDEPSIFGIDEGRVSKLTMYNECGDWLIHYDRGWDLQSDNYTDEYQAIMDLLENSPKRFEY